MTREPVGFVGLIIFSLVGIVVPGISRLNASSAWIVVAGRQVRGLKLVDEDAVDTLLSFLDERFTAEELTELLGITNDDIFDRFRDKILEYDWDEYL